MTTFLESLEGALEEAGAELAAALGKKAPGIARSPVSPTPPVRVSGSGGIAPILNVTHARRVTLALTQPQNMPDGNDYTVLWDTAVDQFGGLWVATDPGGIVIPAAWEGGGLLILGSMIMQNLGAAGNLAQVQARRLRAGVTTFFQFSAVPIGATGFAMVPVVALDALPQPGDRYSIVTKNFDSNVAGFQLDGTNPPETGGLGSLIVARQIFPL